MSRRYRLADPRRPVSPWAAVVALLVCLGIVAVLAQLRPPEGNVGYREQGADGIATTDNVRVGIRNAYVTAAIKRDATSAPATSEGAFVVVEYDATFLRKQPFMPQVSLVIDGKTYSGSLRSDVSLDNFLGYVGFTTHATAVFEVPWERVDGGRFVFGPDVPSGFVPYQIAARLELPDPLPRAAGIVTLTKQTIEVAR